MAIPLTKLLNYIRIAKEELDKARVHGDPLQIDLAEAALNDLLERYNQVR